MPKTKLLPYEWYDTPNIHLFTIKDFKDFCSKENIFIHRQTFTGLGKKNIPECLQPDFFAEFAYFLISDKKESAP
jgi:methionine biosynthesis protein MetW